MSAITAATVKELRERTGAGMMECKKALTESSGDIEGAIDFLRKSGALKAAKKSSRVAAEGLINVLSEGPLVSVVEINCETDFVTKNEDFLKFLSDVNQTIIKNSPANLEALLALPIITDTAKTVAEKTTDLVAKIGENINVRRFALLKAGLGEKVGSYTHMGNKIGVIIKIKGDKVSDEVIRDIAMHTAASAPSYLVAADVPASVVAREKEIYRETLKNEKKPAEVIEKIMVGKINKFFDDICLTGQVFVKDPSGKQKVADFLKSQDPVSSIVEFVRLQVGEGIEKKKDDFAEEVAKLSGI